MTLSVEALLIASLMMAVFAAVSTVGSSLFLGAGFERLRAGFETIKKQTAFFSDQIHQLDTRVEAVEKQGGYFFKAISDLEQEAAKPRQWTDAPPAEKDPEGPALLRASKSDAFNIDLLTAQGFNAEPVRRSLTEQFSATAETGDRPEIRPSFH